MMSPIISCARSAFGTFSSFHWEDLVVSLIVLLCFLEVIRRLIRFFRSSSKHQNPCATCLTGCALKDAFEAQKQKCKDETHGSTKPGTPKPKDCRPKCETEVTNPRTPNP